MNKIDKLLDKAVKFQKIAANIKVAQQNPLEFQQIKAEIQAIKSEIARKIGGYLAGTDLQTQFANFISNQKPSSDGPLFSMIMNEMKSNPKLNSLHTSLLTLLVNLENLSKKYSGLQSSQVKSNSLTSDTINIEDLPNAPQVQSESLEQKIDKDVSALAFLTNKLKQVTQPSADVNQKVSQVDRLIGILDADKKALESAPLTGEVIDYKQTKITNTMLSAVDTITDLMSKNLFNGKVGVNIQKLM